MQRLGLFLLLLLLAAMPASAQEVPKLTGRVVDAAGIIPDDQEPALARKLEAFDTASSRQLVVATIPDLQGYPIEDYGIHLAEAWKIGQKEADNGAILIVAPNERRVRIEVGYGLEPILPDMLAKRIIDGEITPAFKRGDYPGGIDAGVDAIIAQLQAPPEVAEQKVLEARQAEARKPSSRGSSGSLFPLIFWGIVLVFVIIPMLRSRHGGRRYRRSGLPVVIWGPGLGGWGGGSHSSGWGGGSWGGGGWSGGGGGGFSGGGGSFGGGGASGSW